MVRYFRLIAHVCLHMAAALLIGLSCTLEMAFSLKWRPTAIEPILFRIAILFRKKMDRAGRPAIPSRDSLPPNFMLHQ
jgi:hypothetical protein